MIMLLDRSCMMKMPTGEYSMISSGLLVVPQFALSPPEPLELPVEVDPEKFSEPAPPSGGVPPPPTGVLPAPPPPGGIPPKPPVARNPPVFWNPPGSSELLAEHAATRQAVAAQRVAATEAFK